MAEQARIRFAGQRSRAVARASTSCCELSAPGWLARHALIAVLLILLGGLSFGALAYELQTNGPMVQLDTQLSSMFHGMILKTPGPIVEEMTFGFFLGKEDLQLLGAILVVYFLYKKYWPEIGMVLIGWAGGSLIWTPLIYYFNRMRPAQQVGIQVHTIPSFPSGHSMFALLALGLLAYMVVPKMPSLFWKWVVAIAAVLLILFVGFSRVFENGHYLSDVLAGYALGLAWGVLVYTVLEFFVIRRRV